VALCYSCPFYELRRFSYTIKPFLERRVFMTSHLSFKPGGVATRVMQKEQAP
jgi:hypothetical protein